MPLIGELQHRHGQRWRQVRLVVTMVCRVVTVLMRPTRVVMLVVAVVMDILIRVCTDEVVCVGHRTQRIVRW